jgi:hypothetical protein
MKRQLFEIWKDEHPPRITHPWCAQLVNYVGCFSSHAEAERFVASTKKAREQAAKSVTRTK